MIVKAVHVLSRLQLAEKSRGNQCVWTFRRPSIWFMMQLERTLVHDAAV